jgi:hypothetical protein
MTALYKILAVVLEDRRHPLFFRRRILPPADSSIYLVNDIYFIRSPLVGVVIGAATLPGLKFCYNDPVNI